MTRDELLRALAAHADELRAPFAAASLAPFGSSAHGDAGEGSDVDLLVEFVCPGFDGYMDLKFRLEEVVGRPVDLVMCTALKPFGVPTVEREAIRRCSKR